MHECPCDELGISIDWENSPIIEILEDSRIATMLKVNESFLNVQKGVRESYSSHRHVKIPIYEQKHVIDDDM